MLNWCRTFDDYLDMAQAKLNLVYEPIAIPAAQDLKKRIGQEYRYLPFVFDTDELEQNYCGLADMLGMVHPDVREFRKAAEAALERALQCIGNTKIAVDYTFTFRILSFTKMLFAAWISCNRNFCRYILTGRTGGFSLDERTFSGY